MFDANYIKDLTDRAMVFGIDNGWIDADKMIYFREGHMFLNLDSYIEMTDNEVIELPDCFWGILMDVESDKYDPDKHYQFIFPENVYYVGYNAMEDCSTLSGSVWFRKLHKGLTLATTFGNSTFDFRKCKNLFEVGHYGFGYMHAAHVMFNKKLKILGPNAFDGSWIDKLEFESLRSVGPYGLSRFKFEELKLGDHLSKVNSRGLCLEKTLDTVVMSGLTVLSNDFFCNVRNMYISYDPAYLVKKLDRYIGDYQERIRSYLYSYRQLANELGSLTSKIRAEVTAYSNLQDMIFEYKRHSSTELEYQIAETLAWCIQDGQSVDCNFYLYLTGSKKPVEKRKYSCICERSISDLIAHASTTSVGFSMSSNLIGKNYKKDFMVRIYVE